MLGPIADFGATRDGEAVLRRIASAYQEGTREVPRLNAVFAQYSALRTTRIRVPPPPGDRTFLEVVLGELRVQEGLEERWQNLVRTVAPEAGDQQVVFGLLRLVIRQARHNAEQLHAPAPIPFDEALPPQFEQTLERIWRKIP